MPARWQGYLDEAAAKGDATAFRHYWELCTLLAVRDGLRSGDVYVPEFCRLVGKSPDAGEALALVRDELDGALTDPAEAPEKGDGPVRLNEEGELVISPLSAEDIPGEAEEPHAELERMLPNAPILGLHGMAGPGRRPDVRGRPWSGRRRASGRAVGEADGAVNTAVTQRRERAGLLGPGHEVRADPAPSRIPQGAVVPVVRDRCA
ncbi:hypothetical protein [Streptomyces boncukensis]|uniref:Uncharacterized protein n=1 Tax=Streptomyces boncukensis TaxID=2711219 RepID=A0A6G4WSG9_9ACTN|nr:hypothetical protein [Streptomyces boncukensis]NGO67792.1 hypothetical protein [Streptomyces boncukensis]